MPELQTGALFKAPVRLFIQWSPADQAIPWQNVGPDKSVLFSEVAAFHGHFSRETSCYYDA